MRPQMAYFISIVFSINNIEKDCIASFNLNVRSACCVYSSSHIPGIANLTML